MSHEVMAVYPLQVDVGFQYPLSGLLSKRQFLDQERGQRVVVMKEVLHLEAWRMEGRTTEDVSLTLDCGV